MNSREYNRARGSDDEKNWFPYRETLMSVWKKEKVTIALLKGGRTCWPDELSFLDVAVCPWQRDRACPEAVKAWRLRQDTALEKALGQLEIMQQWLRVSAKTAEFKSTTNLLVANSLYASCYTL